MYAYPYRHTERNVTFSFQQRFAYSRFIEMFEPFKTLNVYE